METSQELTLKFMVALASNPAYASPNEDWENDAFNIYTIAKTLTHIYLEKVAWAYIKNYKRHGLPYKDRN